jgi:two-component system, NarL family, sensor kinase
MSPLRTAVAPALAGVTGLLSVGTVLLAWRNGDDPGAFLDGNQANTWLAGLAFGLVAALVLRLQPANRLGHLLTVAAGLTAMCGLAAEYATRTGADLAAWAGSVLWLPGFLLLMVGLPLLFPAGRLPSPRWRWPARVAVAGGALATAAMATTGQVVHEEYPDAGTPFDLPLPDGPQLAVALAGFFVAIAVGVVAIAAIVVRMRRAESVRRRQYAWFVTAIGLALTVGLLSLPEAVAFAGNLLAVAALAVGIVRHGLFDIELVLSRTLVYAVLTAGALAAYLVAAAAVGAGLNTGLGPALVAAVAALVLAGLRHRVQRGVDRLLYGQRGDPLAALTSFGERLGQALDTDAVLPAIVDIVRSTLRLPYVAVRLAGAPAVQSGEAVTATVEFPLAHAGEQIGVLVVAARRGESTLSRSDSRLLREFARQAGVAAHGVVAASDLRRSRERIILAREEERLRIRRDLHDGLGPALAGITLRLETAGRAADRDARSAVPLLQTLREQTAACVEEVRRIVADLRPPTLDQVGLVGALRQHAELLNTSTAAPVISVEVAPNASLPALPAAAEVAAYRIALEAMTNAARHSGGRSCKVGIHHDDTLRVTVHDDGCGGPPARLGVGLASMRERAEELGGRCTVTFRPGRGTNVEAVLPVVVV